MKEESPLKLVPSEQKKTWYRNGLKFKCTECGQCCTGSPGYVWVTQEEAQRISKYVGLTFEQFSSRYLRKTKGKLSLTEQSKTYDCIFLKNKKCTIYPVRPRQCRSFPWWPQNLRTPRDWENAAKFCEGINSEAPQVSFEVIQEQLQNPGVLDE